MVGQIARCRAVLSTSLHGLVVADSFGIPVVWFELEPALWGKDFKFLDYESVVTPGRTRKVTLDGYTALSPLVSANTFADPECGAQHA